MTKGICNICGIKTNLSYEHVPPKAAFNKNTKYVSIKFEDYIQSRNLMKEIPKGKTKQGGIGYNSFCEKCNNFFGANYVNAYVKWVNAGVQLLADSEFASCYFEIKNIEPLSILKQIISMFLAINDNSFSNDFKELSEFVINKESKILPEKFQIYTYLTRAERLRYMKYSAIGDLNTRQTVLCSEMAYPPFGYVLTIDSKINKKYLRNITEFKNYDFNENKDFIMSLAQLPTYTIYSLDYRSKDKLNNDIEKANNLMDNIDKFRKENS